MFRTGLEDLVEKVANALPAMPNLKKPVLAGFGPKWPVLGSEVLVRRGPLFAKWPDPASTKKPLWQKALPYGLAAGAGFAYYQGRANQQDAKYKNLVSAPTEGSY